MSKWQTKQINALRCNSVLSLLFTKRYSLTHVILFALTPYLMASRMYLEALVAALICTVLLAEQRRFEFLGAVYYQTFGKLYCLLNIIFFVAAAWYMAEGAIVNAIACLLFTLAVSAYLWSLDWGFEKKPSRLDKE